MSGVNRLINFNGSINGSFCLYTRTCDSVPIFASRITRSTTHSQELYSNFESKEKRTQTKGEKEYGKR